MGSLPYVSIFEAGIEDALTYLRYPGSHHARILRRIGAVLAGLLAIIILSSATDIVVRSLYVG